MEELILGALISNEEYTRAVSPFLQEEYFDDHSTKTAFSIIQRHLTKYNTIPTKSILFTTLDGIPLNEDQFKQTKDLIEKLTYEPKTDNQWLIDTTEKFCQDKALYNAVRKSILVMDGKEKGLEKGSIPQILSDALAISFNTAIGHDFTQDSDARYEFYHKVENRIEFDIDYINKITKGGFARKSLVVFLGGTGGGKTLTMCHLAASAMALGRNVLYISLEMSEEMIAQRIDANLLDVEVDDLLLLPKTIYDTKINKLKNRVTGKLIIKEYPPTQAGANHFRHLLNELKLKKKFTPDLIFVDYINLAASSRIKLGANVNTYSYIKAVAEELRGLAVEHDVSLVTATQTNRTGYGSSDPELTETSDSFGLPMTADAFFSISTSEELEKLGQVMFKQLKNRWGDINSPRRFVVGINRAKMKLFNLEESAQDGLTNDGPVMNRTSMGKHKPSSYEEDFVIEPSQKGKRNYGDLT
jgi:archaellum biogenesis ATPase FlaH